MVHKAPWCRGAGVPPISIGKLCAFPAPFAEITRGKRDVKLLMRLLHTTRSVSVHRDLKNNLISTVQPGAFLGLPELKRL